MNNYYEYKLGIIYELIPFNKVQSIWFDGREYLATVGGTHIKITAFLLFIEQYKKWLSTQSGDKEGKV